MPQTYLDKGRRGLVGVQVQTRFGSDPKPPDPVPNTSRNTYNPRLPLHLFSKAEILKNNLFGEQQEYAERASNLTNLVQQLGQY
jgi:hypothetical protein